MNFNDNEMKDLIKTKHSKPNITSYFIPRLRLTEKLNQALTRKVTIVSAPAGYGKSTAVLEWLGSRSLKSAWVSLDEKDNDPYAFWLYICHALSGIDRLIISDTSYVFSSRELFEAGIHLNIILDRLNDAGSDVFMVLDDFHTITEPRILDSFAYFVNYLPPNVHLVLISRSEPGEQLAHLEIKGHLLRLSADDLRFRHTQIRQFYEKRGHYLDNTDIGSIERYSEGWAASLVAVAISLDDKRYGNRLKKGAFIGNANLDQYLLSEACNTWTDNKKAFFLRTSFLDAFCGGLCDAVTGFEGCGSLLEQLNKGNSFLIPYDEKDGWYRYHHIFKDFLFRRLMESGSNNLSELYKKSALWFLENGYPAQAIEHYLTGGHYEVALNLIEKQRFFILDSGDFLSALSWIKRLPEAYVENSHAISAIQAEYYASTGRYELSKHWISRMETIAAGKTYSSDETEKLAKTECQLIRAHCLILEGDLIEVSSILRSVTENGGSQYTLQNEYAELNPCDIYFYRCPANSLITLYENQPDLFWEIFSSYQPFIQKSPGYASLMAGEYLYEKDLLDESIDFLLKAMKTAADAGCPGALVPSMITIARISKASGDIRGALAAVEECETWLQSINKMHWEYLLMAFKARLYLDSEDVYAGELWLESCKLGIYHEITKAREFELLVYARFLIARGSVNEAEILSKRLLAFSRGLDRKHSMVEILNLLSIPSFRNGEKEKALDYLEKSIAIGMDEVYIRSFSDEGEPMAILLSRFTAKGKKQRTYVQTLKKRFAEGIPSPEVEDTGALQPASKQLTR